MSSDEQSAVRSEFADDEDFREVLDLFLQSISEKCDSFRALHSKGATEQIGVMAHQLKGAAGGYGFPGLSKAAAELEQACKAHEPHRIAVAIDELLAYLARIES
jgi:histidine phosphotransfer protein HptB